MDATDDCPYREVSADPWTDAVVAADDDGVVLMGTCTRCAHRTSYASRDTWTAAAASERGDADRPLIIIRCDCEDWHDPGELTDTQGCGAYWRYPEPAVEDAP